VKQNISLTYLVCALCTTPSWTRKHKKSKSKQNKAIRWCCVL